MQKMIYHLGVDIGSTTIKFVVLDEKERIIFKDYFRHLSDPSTAFLQEIQKILAIIDGREFSLILTGSAGFGFAERMGVPHVQEVIACRAALRSLLPEAETAVELGGEDAKITWLGSSPEQRMNGVCAGGTGAFIDHMASLLGTDAAGLGSMAESCKRMRYIRQVWLPLISTHSPLSSLQAIPTRSASGSLAITKSASISLARFTAIVNASAFSGFGETTVGKLPSLIICSGTVYTFSNPHIFNARGISFIPVP